jgi:hypothetical protein
VLTLGLDNSISNINASIKSIDILKAKLSIFFDRLSTQPAYREGDTFCCFGCYAYFKFLTFFVYNQVFRLMLKKSLEVKSVLTSISDRFKQFAQAFIH